VHHGRALFMVGRWVKSLVCWFSQHLVLPDTWYHWERAKGAQYEGGHNGWEPTTTVGGTVLLVVRCYVRIYRGQCRHQERYQSVREKNRAAEGSLVFGNLMWTYICGNMVRARVCGHLEFFTMIPSDKAHVRAHTRVFHTRRITWRNSSHETEEILLLL